MQELIVPIRLMEKGRRGVVGTAITGPQLKYPTTIALAGNRLLAVNSQFDKRSAMQPPELPFDVASIAVPKAPEVDRGDRGDTRRDRGDGRGRARGRRGSR